MSNLIERLNVPWESSDEPTMKKINRFIKERKEAAAEIARLRGREEEYRKALAPFADIAKAVAENHPGWDHDAFEFALLAYTVTLAPFRATARALDPTKQKGDQDGGKPHGGGL